MKFSIRKLILEKINRKLTLSFLIIILLFSVFGYFSLVQNQQILKETIGESSASLVQEEMDKIERNIHSKIETWQFYSRLGILHEFISSSNKEFDNLSNVNDYIIERDQEWISAEGITPFMQELMENRFSKVMIENLEFYEEKYGKVVFGEVFITNKYGANIIQTGKTSDYYQADENWWKSARKDGLFVTDVEYDESSGLYSTDICIRIDDKEGNFLGVMKVILNIGGTIDIISDLSPEAYGDGTGESNSHSIPEFKLLDSEGRVIYSTKVGFGVFEEMPEELLLRFEESEEQYFMFSEGESGEADKLLAYAHSNGYRDFKGLDWILILEYEADEIFAPVAAVGNMFLTASIGVIIITILMGFIISRKISSPINKLYLATKELERENLKTRVNIKTGDELEELGDAFNKTMGVLEEMDKRQKQLERAKTEFLSITSHELRSPMTPMKAQLQMLMSEYFGKLGEKQKKAIDIVLRNTTRLDNIIMDFLDISRIEAARLKFKFIKANLSDYAKRLVEEMGGFMPEKNIEIVANIDRLPEIEVDPDRAMQVLRNLVNNAKKFSPKNTKIFVDVNLQGKMILFSVKDQGIGITKENQLRIFEPFFQAEQTMYREHGGTGLGLTICRGIIESQKGRMWVESESGKGSTFYFTVPLTPVTEIKPIKLLFSSKKSIEREIEELLKSMLGPIATSEFEVLKKKGELIKESLIEYVDVLIKVGVIDKERGKEFKSDIVNIFGGKSKGERKEKPDKHNQ